MFSKWKISVLAACAMFCVTGSLPAYADTAEETTEIATEAATEEPEEIVSGEYTYYINEEYGGAVLTVYEPEEADVVIPEEVDGHTVVGLENFLFDRQDSIETVTIPATLRHIGASAFYGTSIHEFIVEDDHPAYKTIDGVLFSKDGIALVAYPPKKEDTAYAVPDGVEELYHGCFAQALNLQEITLPDSLLYVDTWAFAYTLLQELEIPDSVIELGSYACAYMTRLAEFKTPKNISLVASATFAGCAQLSDVTLHEGLVEIGQGAFAGTAVRDIVIPTTVQTIGYCALGYDTNMSTSYSTLVIYGLSGSVAQTYATDKDTEYDYKNNFTFIAKTEAQIQEMLSGEAPAEDSENAAEDATDSDVVIKTEDKTNGSFIMKMVLLVLGGIVLCGGIVAVVMSSKKKS